MMMTRVDIKYLQCGAKSQRTRVAFSASQWLTNWRPLLLIFLLRQVKFYPCTHKNDSALRNFSQFFPQVLPHWGLPTPKFYSVSFKFSSRLRVLTRQSLFIAVSFSYKLQVVYTRRDIHRVSKNIPEWIFKLPTNLDQYQYFK